MEGEMGSSTLARAFRTCCASLLLGFTFGDTHAQTMTNGNGSPVAGEVFTVYYGPGPDPGPGGADVVWDMSTLQVQGTTTKAYVDPVGTPWSDLFPLSTVARVTPSGYVYYQATEEGFDEIGSGSTIVGPDSCWDHQRELYYPLEFGTTWSDDYQCGDSLSYWYGNTTCTVDGWGTLILPDGTVENVLRESCTGFSVFVAGEDTVGDGVPATFSLYFKPGIHHSLLSINNTPNKGWLDLNSLGLEQDLDQAIGIDLSPNPAAGSITVDHSCTSAHMVGRIVDATGRVVLERPLGGNIGICRAVIDVSMLPPGMYTLRISDHTGEQGSERFMVL